MRSLPLRGEGDVFTPRRIFDRLSAAGVKGVEGTDIRELEGTDMTEGRVGAGKGQVRAVREPPLRGRGSVCGYVGTMERAHH